MEQDVPSDIEYCPACKCMIERWWNYCAICGFHTATNDQQRNETCGQSGRTTAIPIVVENYPAELHQNRKRAQRAPKQRAI